MHTQHLAQRVICGGGKLNTDAEKLTPVGARTSPEMTTNWAGTDVGSLIMCFHNCAYSSLGVLSRGR